MKNLTTSTAAIAVLTISMGCATAADETTAPARGVSTQVMHAPVQVLRRDDGTVERNRNNAFVTQNWSGYAVANFQTKDTYLTANATWVVPTVTYDNTSDGYSSTWVGIGGFCLSALCTRVDRSLIQLGTEQEAHSNGNVYYPWYEMLPNASVRITADNSGNPVSVNSGDTIIASLTCLAHCSSHTQTWQLMMTDTPQFATSQAWLWSHNFSYSSSLASAEWIEEAPSSVGGILPLADFQTVGIDPVGAAKNNSPIASTSPSNSIELQDPWGQQSTPSSSDAPGDGFNACFSATQGAQTCAETVP